MFAEITVQLRDVGVPTGVKMFRANANSAYVFMELPTRIISGKAVASTNQGGIFVAGSGVNYNLVIGLSVAGVVLLLVAIMVAATVVYFVVRPEKLASAKNNIQKTQMKMKRSFAKQV